MYIKVLMLFPLTLWGYVETVSLADALKSVDAHTLVVLDLDDTLIRYPSHLGSTAWFEEAHQNMPADEFHRVAGLLATRLSVVCVEEKGLAAISAAQSTGASVMGITRRTLTHPGCANWPELTAEQVRSAGITFTPPSDHELYGGILITDGKAKGETLLKWLSGVTPQPTRILFVDDRKGEVEDVERTLSPHYPTISVWYRYQEVKGIPYDSEAALTSLRQLKADLAAQDQNP